MLPTHALAGMAIALVTLVLAPEFAGVALLAGLLGGAFPDFDLYTGHRKTLHYPVYYPLAAFAALVFAALAPSAGTIFAAFFLTGAAAHSASDVLGGGLELRPWEATSDRAVYDHHHGKWIAPRRWVPYDGSPGDLLAASVLAVPLALAVDGLLYWVVIAALAVATIYAAVRRYLPTIAELLVDTLAPRLPAHVLARVPARYLTR